MRLLIINTFNHANLHLALTITCTAFRPNLYELALTRGCRFFNVNAWPEIVAWGQKSELGQRGNERTTSLNSSTTNEGFNRIKTCRILTEIDTHGAILPIEYGPRNAGDTVVENGGGKGDWIVNE